jgi:hypothetical protein
MKSIFAHIYSVSAIYRLNEACDLMRREVLYTVHIEFYIPVKLVRLFKMFLKEILSYV